jgi:hypothetical protein
MSETQDTLLNSARPDPAGLLGTVGLVVTFQLPPWKVAITGSVFPAGSIVSPTATH